MRLSMTRNAGMAGVFALALAFALPAQAATARLPVRHYTSADGLAQDQVQRLAVDADGFVWVATAGGLSRFDGSRFANFGEAEGLRVSLAAARDKLAQLDERTRRAATVSLGIPAYRDIAARTATVPGNLP